MTYNVKRDAGIGYGFTYGMGSFTQEVYGTDPGKISINLVVRRPIEAQLEFSPSGTELR